MGCIKFTLAMVILVFYFLVDFSQDNIPWIKKFIELNLGNNGMGVFGNEFSKYFLTLIYT